MKRALTQTWWAPVAAVLALGLLLLGLNAPFGKEDAESKIASMVLAIGPAIAIAVGLVRRARDQRGGTSLIVIGGFFGVFWFWTLVLPILGLIVLLGVGVSAASRRSAQPTDSSA